MTNTMEQSFSSEVHIFSASSVMPRIFLKPEGSLPHSQQPTSCLYPEPGQSITYPHPTS
jgi:hypothetical protein